MAVEPAELTYGDYLRTPDDGLRYEIIEGELFVTPSPSIKHQVVSVNLLRLLLEHVRPAKLGRVLAAPCTVLLSENEPLEPDLLFVLASRLNIIRENFVDGAPDLVIEILSAAHARNDTLVKFNRYLKAGVPEYWIVDPEGETVRQFVLGSNIYVPLQPLDANIIGSEVVDGLRIALADVFDMDL